MKHLLKYAILETFKYMRRQYISVKSTSLNTVGTDIERIEYT